MIYIPTKRSVAAIMAHIEQAKGQGLPTNALQHELACARIRDSIENAKVISVDASKVFRRMRP